VPDIAPGTLKGVLKYHILTTERGTLFTAQSTVAVVGDVASTTQKCAKLIANPKNKLHIKSTKKMNK